MTTNEPVEMIPTKQIKTCQHPRAGLWSLDSVYESIFVNGVEYKFYGLSSSWNVYTFDSKLYAINYFGAGHRWNEVFELLDPKELANLDHCIDFTFIE